MTVSALASLSCYESHLYPSKNMAGGSFFGETITASSLLSQIEEMSQRSFSRKRNQMPGEKVGKNVYKCPNCGRQYLHKGNLKQHLKFECGKEPQWQCPFCPKKTKLKGNLKQHIVLVHETPSARAQNGKGQYIFK